MTNLTPPPAPGDHPDVALEMLRISRERYDAANNALSYMIATARTHGVPWSAIAHEVGLSELTCRRRLANYTGEQEDAA